MINFIFCIFVLTRLAVIALRLPGRVETEEERYLSLLDDN